MEIISRLGPDEWSYRRPPGISELDITPVFEISLRRDAKVEESPHRWHRGLSFLKDKLEGSEE